MSGSQENSGYPSGPQRFPSGPTVPPHLRVEINTGNTVTPPRNEPLQQRTTPHGFQRPSLDLDYLPLSVFTMYERFDLMLNRAAPEWWHVLKEATVRVGYSLLSGRISPKISLTLDDALVAIDETIHWKRLRKNDPGWYPIGPPQLRIDRYMQPFQTNLADITFRELLYGELMDVPTVFFARVRSSIQQLICTPPMNALHSYPRCSILNPQQLIIGDPQQRLVSLVEWDTRWGYNHWHQFTHNTHGYTALWFSDPGMRDIIYHALRTESSIGYLAVLYPQDFPPHEFTADVPVNIETISFILAALAIEIKQFSKTLFTPPGVHKAYIENFQTEKNRIHDILWKIWDGSLNSGDRIMEEEMRQGLESCLNSYATR